MKPILELTLRGTDKVVAVACGKCRRVAHDERMAEECCMPYKCKRCGTETERYYTICAPCLAARKAKQEHARFETAEKVSWQDYDWPVYCGENNNYYVGAQECAEDICESGLDCPTYVWACKRISLKLDADDVVTNALKAREHHDDAGVQISTNVLDELQRYLDEWCAARGIESWTADYSKAVLLDGIFDVEEQGDE